ncbi:hypothetical protein V6N11_056107 [Hibiscus sabdariffa]|uniref:Uncharacterized protein n=1 Tax=Hibiscus sabdariffa TaxID=183260 RepID=A0ABR2T3G8_9ROSI
MYEMKKMGDLSPYQLNRSGSQPDKLDLTQIADRLSWSPRPDIPASRSMNRNPVALRPLLADPSDAAQCRYNSVQQRNRGLLS